MGMQGAATVPSVSEALAAAALTSQAATAPARPPALAAAAAPSRVPAHAAAALTAAALAAAALATSAARLHAQLRTQLSLVRGRGRWLVHHRRVQGLALPSVQSVGHVQQRRLPAAHPRLHEHGRCQLPSDCHLRPE
jgi:hypothetical protein